MAFLPVSELRGAIPFAAANGVPWFTAWLFAVAVNILVAPVFWVFLSTLHKLLYGTTAGESAGVPFTGAKGFAWYRNLFDRLVIRARNKLKSGIEKWGWFGVALFVAIPLPFTGAWTGTLGAWVLGVPRRKTLIAVTIGVMAAGAIVSAVTILGIRAFDIFIKKTGGT